MAYVKIRPRRGTQSQWEYANPILSEGEMAFEVPETGVGTGLINIKQGDGQNSWNSLPYAFNAGDLNTKVDDLANTVATYDGTIRTLSQDVSNMKEQVEKIRQIDIQGGEPAVTADDVPGRIWINTDMVTGSLSIDHSSLVITPGAQQVLTVTSTLSSVSNIQWESSDSGVVSLSNIIPLQSGQSKCTITGNVATGSVPVTVSASAILNGAVIYRVSCKVEVKTNGGITVTPSDAKLIVGSTGRFNCRKTDPSFEYDTIQWASSASYVASVTGWEVVGGSDADVSGVAIGSSIIYARAVLNGFYIDTVQVPVQIVGFVIDKTNVTIGIGDSARLDLAGHDSMRDLYDQIVWRSGGENVVRITQSDNLHADIVGVTAGAAYIYADILNDGQLVQSLSCYVVVNGSIELSDSVISMTVGDSPYALTIRNTLAPGTWDELRFENTDNSVINIDDHSSTAIQVKALLGGSSVITVTALLNSATVDSASCVVNVTGTIEIEQGATASVVDGTTIPLTLANTLGSESYNIRWTVDNSSIVRIEPGQTAAGCQITGVAVGTATVTVTAYDTITELAIASDAIDVSVIPS